MANFASMDLTSIVMHQVLSSPDDPTQRFSAVMTDEPVVMQPADRAFLKQRFVRVLSGRGLPIIEDTGAAGPVCSSVRTIWSPSSDFVAQTKSIAAHLAMVQPGSAQEGLLMVAKATVPHDELLLVAKVEHQEAMRIEPTVNDAGHNIFEIERLNDLVFGDLARIYKVAILSRAASATGTLGGEIVDEQNGMGFAAYFLKKFLGMALREEPAVLTERFLDRMTIAINDSTMSAEQKLDAQSALLSELRSNAQAIEPEAFIRNHIPNGHGSEVRSLASEASAPLVRFAKDTGRLDSRLSRLRVDLDNGVVVMAPAEAVGQGQDVQIEKATDGMGDIVTARGRVKQIRASGGH
ncbi:nucleoid-associated protein [Streptomyces sp. ISL-90]|nr:nucleoid-associated protein [Streptomyces sp. ISL-90]